VTARLAGSSLSWRIDSPDQVDETLAEIKSTVGLDPTIDDVALMVIVGICPSSVIYDPLAIEAFSLYRAIEDGRPWPWPGGWYDQPALFDQCCRVIRDEQMKIQMETQPRGDK